MNMLPLIRDKTPSEFRFNDLIRSNESALITFLNPYSYSLGYHQAGEFGQMDYILIDGIGLVKTLKWFAKQKTNRYSFDMTSLAPEVFQSAEDNGFSVYFVGAKPQEIEKFICVVLNKYPKMQVAGYRNGYFNSDDERNQCIKDILKSEAKVAIVGMGTPLQERFLSDLRKQGFEGIGFSCGGFIHQTSEGLYYYPKWIDRFQLRSVYRLFKEKLFGRLPLFLSFLKLFFGDVRKEKRSRKVL